MRRVEIRKVLFVRPGLAPAFDVLRLAEEDAQRPLNRTTRAVGRI